MPTTTSTVTSSSTNVGFRSTLLCALLLLFVNVSTAAYDDASGNSGDIHVDITSLHGLNTQIVAGPLRTVGFLSTGNYHAVQNELHHTVQPVFFDTSEHLHRAVRNGSILAGLVSGTPHDTDGLRVFGSEQISLRAILVGVEHTDLLRAIDAAIVRLVERGAVDALIETHYPYEMLVAHSCKPTADHFEWPVLENAPSFGYGDDKVIRISSLGPYNWGGTDGDYTVNPPTGFWPGYYALLEAEMQQQYGIRFERHWYATSKDVLDSITNGTTHMSEPYMMVGAAYNDVSRKSAFSLSCTTGATQDKYFVRAPNRVVVYADEEDSSRMEDCDDAMVAAASRTYLLVTIGALSMLSMALLLVLVRMMCRRTLIVSPVA